MAKCYLAIYENCAGEKQHYFICANSLPSTEPFGCGVRWIIDGSYPFANDSVKYTTWSQVPNSDISLAQSLAISAIGIAQQSRSIAGTAESKATVATASAANAQQTSHEAQSTAATANSKATAATVKADNAGNFAKQALGKAGDAFNKALEAATIALTVLSLYQGLKALKGLPGLPGLPGRNGRDGRNGIDGRPGRDGVTTVVQIPGRQGDRGFPGISGLPGRNGRNGIDGRPGRDGRDVNPADLAGLRAFIAAQHAQTRAAGTALHATTRTYILTPIMAALAPILAICKQISVLQVGFFDGVTNKNLKDSRLLLKRKLLLKKR